MLFATSLKVNEASWKAEVIDFATIQNHGGNYLASLLLKATVKKND